MMFFNDSTDNFIYHKILLAASVLCRLFVRFMKKNSSDNKINIVIVIYQYMWWLALLYKVSVVKQRKTVF
jgi:hypothetical protein